VVSGYAGLCRVTSFAPAAAALDFIDGLFCTIRQALVLVNIVGDDRY
jgi:hypothetical protein